MKLTIVQAPISEIETDALVVGAFHKAELRGPAREVDEAAGGVLGSAVSEGAFKGGPYEAEWVYPAPGVKARRALMVGAGKEDQFDVRCLRNVAGAAARQARKKGAKTVCFALPGPQGLPVDRAVEVIADGVSCGLSDSDLYKDSSDKNQIEEAAIWVAPGVEPSAAEAGLRRGEKIAAAVNFARWLGDEPPNVMTTERLAQEARRMAEAHGIECEVLDEE